MASVTLLDHIVLLVSIFVHRLFNNTVSEIMHEHEWSLLKDQEENGRGRFRGPGQNSNRVPLEWVRSKCTKISLLDPTLHYSDGEGGQRQRKQRSLVAVRTMKSFSQDGRPRALNMRQQV